MNNMEKFNVYEKSLDINGEPRRGYLNGEFWLGPAGIILGRQLVDIAIASPLIVV
jgi:hypothetical protein